MISEKKRASLVFKHTIVCTWPLKSNGFSLHGGVASSQTESKSVGVPSFLVNARGEAECVKVTLAWPSHSMVQLIVVDNVSRSRAVAGCQSEKQQSTYLQCHKRRGKKSMRRKEREREREQEGNNTR